MSPKVHRQTLLCFVPPGSSFSYMYSNKTDSDKFGRKGNYITSLEQKFLFRYSLVLQKM